MSISGYAEHISITEYVGICCIVLLYIYNYIEVRCKEVLSRTKVCTDIPRNITYILSTLQIFSSNM
jgi:hypothetical protein